eukprot:53965_1
MDHDAFEMPTFVDLKAAEQFICSICLNVFNKPVQIGCTGHVFCDECVQPLIKRDGTLRCPICRLQCHCNTIHRVQFIDRQIKNLLVKCPNHEMTSKKSEYIAKKQSQNKGTSNSNNTNNKNHAFESDSDSDSDDEDRVVVLRRSARLKEKCSRKKRKRSYVCDEDQQRSRKKAKTNDNELCGWIGCFSDLNCHMDKCPLQLSNCKYCVRPMLQRDLVSHYEECIFFPITCDQCNEVNIFRCRMPFHIENKCVMTKIECPQKCGKKLLRKRERSHIANRCSETVINCIFHPFGCDVKFKRKKSNQHFENNHQKHLIGLAHDHERLSIKVRDLDTKYNTSEQRNQELKTQINEQHGHISALWAKIHRLESIFNSNERVPSSRTAYQHHEHTHYRR